MSFFEYKPVPLTERLHTRVYEAIHPSQPSLSQTGKTVLVTGGSAGIGYAIAKNFGIARADRIIITGRTREKLDAAVSSLDREQEASQGHGTTTKFEGRLCQISDSDSINHLFDELAADGVHVDVLVLNAVLNVAGRLSDQGWERTWEQFVVNVRSIHQLCDRLFQQAAPRNRTYYIVNVSTGAIHDFGSPKDLSSYSLTKNAGALLLQKLADERGSPETQIISFHPGAVFTAQVKEKGMTEMSMNWDDAFLVLSPCGVPRQKQHSCTVDFLWAAWDVDEMKAGSMGKRLRTDDKFLRIGVHGL
ncbi:hypothetical protein NM208_g3713 [Fusarium decemcellulare]|uniref:Uncharacterized protein n=1 Tax=Fusarium decemcellulare TaxID=57161 RepID=A0ACC1SN35_9HYPO|nr:hypothetical protein NM208_g3713 [Fusarium decemcellulare]